MTIQSIGRNGEWRVNVRKQETDEVNHTVWCKSEREADRVERGMNINLNHDDFYTEVADHGSFTKEAKP